MFCSHKNLTKNMIHPHFVHLKLSSFSCMCAGFFFTTRSLYIYVVCCCAYRAYPTCFYCQLFVESLFLVCAHFHCAKILTWKFTWNHAFTWRQFSPTEHMNRFTHTLHLLTCSHYAIEIQESTSVHCTS